MRTLEDRTQFFVRLLTEGGHHLVPVRQRIELWRLDMRFWYTPEQIDARVKSSLERERGGSPLLPPIVVEAIAVLNLYGTAMNLPCGLLTAEVQLLATAPGRDEPASQ